MTTRSSPSPLRRMLSRSVATLREVAHPARVLAWYCPRCREWVPPRRFTLTTATCRPCARQLLDEGVIPRWHDLNR